MFERRLSNSAVDRLGERLRRGNYSDDDLKLLEDYRQSFADAFERVAGTVERAAQVTVSSRRAKSTPSVIDKLRRESIRLSQMQDIAGCRVVVSDLADQDGVIASLSAAFDRVIIVDRRLKPSYGYRAAHVIASESGRHVEVQVRTELQHVWAQLCEKAADLVDNAIKYGGGPPDLRRLLDSAASAVRNVEEGEKKIWWMRRELASLEERGLRGLREGTATAEWFERLTVLKQSLASLPGVTRNEIIALLQSAALIIEKETSK